MLSSSSISASISIHATREGGDGSVIGNVRSGTIFQSTPPVRVATIPVEKKGTGVVISIHATREGGDAETQRSLTAEADFNPRHP